MRRTEQGSISSPANLISHDGLLFRTIALYFMRIPVAAKVSRIGNADLMK
jgi:hypothetical protein